MPPVSVKLEPTTTEYADLGQDGEFRRYVREHGFTQGFGRMQQIIDEEWRAADAVRGGLIVLCRNCDTLINAVSGQPRRPTKRSRRHG